MKKLVCLFASLLFACSSSDPEAEGPQADEYNVDCAGTDAGTGVTSDENFAAFVNAEAAGKVVDSCKGPQLTAPAAGATLSAQTPPDIKFNDNSCPATPIRPRTGLRRVPRQAPRYSRVIEALLSRISGEAQAHCGAISGINYYFKILPAGGGTPLYTAMLSVTSFTPDATKWRTAMAGRSGQTVTVVLEGANFLKGEILEGPFRAQTTFTVVP